MKKETKTIINFMYNVINMVVKRQAQAQVFGMVNFLQYSTTQTGNKTWICFAFGFDILLSAKNRSMLFSFIEK